MLPILHIRFVAFQHHSTWQMRGLDICVSLQGVHGISYVTIEGALQFHSRKIVWEQDKVVESCMACKWVVDCFWLEGYMVKVYVLYSNQHQEGFVYINGRPSWSQAVGRGPWSILQPKKLHNTCLTYKSMCFISAHNLPVFITHRIASTYAHIHSYDHSDALQDILKITCKLC